MWVGFDDNKELPSGNYNQKLWKGIMSRIHKNLPYKDFEVPGFSALKHTFPEAEPYVSDKENIGIRFEKRRK